MSKKFLKAFAIATAFAAGVSSINYIAPTPVAEAQQTVANYTYSAQVTQYLKELNAVRKASGAPELTIDARLSESAQNHAVYANTHGITVSNGHTEDKNKSGYTGATPEERFLAVGGSMQNYGTLSEAVATSGLGLKNAFENLLESTGHRSVLLAGYSNTVGVGISGNAIVFVTATNESGVSADYTSVKYPYNGQTNVDTAYDLTNVSSSPLTQYGVSKAGYVVSFSPVSIKRSSAFNIELYDSKNVRVETLNPKSQSDGNRFFFYTIPKNVLKGGEKYTAKATWTDDNGNPQSETWTFTTAGKSTTDPSNPTNPSKPPVGSIDVSKFADYRADQYWAEDFQWAVNRGIINGYQNVYNPVTKKYENLLKPNTNLTENQMLSVLLRYFKPDELTSTKPKTSWVADVNYQLASKYGLPVNGANTVSKQALANKDITRGNFAHILASMHYGKTVTQPVAIQFLRDYGLTTAKTDKDFMPTSSLTRAHAVAFFHRYEQTFK
ncbi:CAP domain-containing protein [Lysinibacillus sphaericus]|uniref:CAP and S-layer homology domain-containing protein n=1 Tax=Lysinibacillus sphaericus TaxID=1421 RepID=UPI0018CF8DD6|nr:CAP domain-containing protein [Lysinibacillus sphaericus]